MQPRIHASLTFVVTVMADKATPFPCGPGGVVGSEIGPISVAAAGDHGGGFKDTGSITPGGRRWPSFFPGHGMLTSPSRRAAGLRPSRPQHVWIKNNLGRGSMENFRACVRAGSA